MGTRPANMHRYGAWLAQTTLYTAFACVLALFSSWPNFRSLRADEGVITVSIAHHGQRLQPCRDLSAEELARLPPNMRAQSSCPRERAPLLVEAYIDGELVLRQLARPAGLSGDGAGKMHRRIPVTAGWHRIAVRMRDSNRSEGFDYVRQERIELRPAEILVVDFDSEQREFTLR